MKVRKMFWSLRCMKLFVTVGFMAEGQKIFGLPTTYGGFRINSYFRVFADDHLLNFTLYGEYEGLNGAALYKMEVAGFGSEGERR